MATEDKSYRTEGEPPKKVREAAEKLNVSPYTIRDWIAKRKLGFIRLGPRAIRIPASEIQRLLETGMTPPLLGSRRR